MEDVITRHFHDHCYLGEIHDHCRITQWKSLRETIVFGEILDLRMKLIEGGLAMVIYPVATIQYHCVLVGFDRQEKKFIKRDPAKRQILPEDFLLNKPITEYILFESA